jgi:hypothetical protein
MNYFIFGLIIFPQQLFPQQFPATAKNVDIIDFFCNCCGSCGSCGNLGTARLPSATDTNPPRKLL